MGDDGRRHGTGRRGDAAAAEDDGPRLTGLFPEAILEGSPAFAPAALFPFITDRLAVGQPKNLSKRVNRGGS